MLKRKLLLADDSITIQKVVNLTFADEGIEVVAVGNGDQAVDRLEEVAPDLVLADVHMPGLSGYEVCEKVRSHSRFGKIPVMLLVGSFEPFDEAEAERVGANAHLTKPFQSIRQLVSKVSELLSAQTSDSSENASLTDEMQNSDGTSLNISDMKDDNTFSIGNNLTINNSNETLAANYSALNLDDDPLEDEVMETSHPNHPEFDALSDNFSNKPSFMEEAADETAYHSTNRRTVGSFDINDADVSADEKNEIDTDEKYSAFSFNSAAESAKNETADEEPIGFSAQSKASESEKSFNLTSNNEVMELPSSHSLKYEDHNRAEVPEPPVETYTDEDFELELDHLLPLFAAGVFDEDTILEINTDNFSQGFVNRLMKGKSSVTPEDIARRESEMEQLFADEDTAVVSGGGHFAREIAEVTRQYENNMGQNAGQSTDLALNSPYGLTNATQFPSEVIEAIAQKVVEKLSDRVVREIAWEVVPELSELMIKKYMDKDMRRR